MFALLTFSIFAPGQQNTRVFLTSHPSLVSDGVTDASIAKLSRIRRGAVFALTVTHGVARYACTNRQVNRTNQQVTRRVSVRLTPPSADRATRPRSCTRA